MRSGVSVPLAARAASSGNSGAPLSFLAGSPPRWIRWCNELRLRNSESEASIGLELLVFLAKPWIPWCYTWVPHHAHPIRTSQAPAPPAPPPERPLIAAVTNSLVLIPLCRKASGWGGSPGASPVGLGAGVDDGCL